ncbi:MAG: hypothetical protein HXY48_08070 [Ignavibacteriaceae bacterium]|nr:hypothetical protein [Ignavibacteriaceae bacterium]
MFEKEIKFIGDFCYNQVKSLGTNFTLEKITSAGVHPAVVQYISAELDFMIYSDRRKLLQQSYFDYAGKEIFEHFQKISSEIKRNKKISIEDAKKLIFQAVSFNINYLVRPKWSLTKLIFNEQPIISVEELQMMLKYLYYYEYFRKVLSAYLSKRKLVQISLTEFDLILNKIDSELFTSNQEQLIDNALSSMGDFFNVGGVDKNLISSTAIEIFLKEKNMLDLVFRLRKGMVNGVKKQFDKNELKKILIQQTAGENIEGLQIQDSKIVIEDQDGITIESEVEDAAPITDNLSPKNLSEVADTDIESFLSPEEEETLLSLYDEELIHQTGNEQDIPVTDDINDLSADLVQTESKTTDDFGLELDDLSVDSTENEILNQAGSESQLLETGVEKEIVEEMIRDFVGEDQKSDIEKNILDHKSQEHTGEVVEEVVPKSTAFDDELLNLFENIDEYYNNISSKESTEEIIEEITEEHAVESKDLSSPVPEADEIDEFIKNIDEISFINIKDKTEDIQKEPEVHIETKEPEQIEIIKEEVVERKDTVVQKEKITRIQRQKDLFSYLKRKEMKKIVSYIFANDEEDFTNTVERIMDCHSYKDASEILKAVFTSYKISPYSKEAITFTNAVSNYFRQA